MSGETQGVISGEVFFIPVVVINASHQQVAFFDLEALLLDEDRQVVGRGVRLHRAKNEDGTFYYKATENYAEQINVLKSDTGAFQAQSVLLFDAAFIYDKDKFNKVCSVQVSFKIAKWSIRRIKLTGRNQGKHYKAYWKLYDFYNDAGSVEERYWQG